MRCGCCQRINGSQVIWMKVGDCRVNSGTWCSSNLIFQKCGFILVSKNPNHFSQQSCCTSRRESLLSGGCLDQFAADHGALAENKIIMLITLVQKARRAQSLLSTCTVRQVWLSAISSTSPKRNPNWRFAFVTQWRRSRMHCKLTQLSTQDSQEIIIAARLEGDHLVHIRMSIIMHKILHSDNRKLFKKVFDQNHL